MYFYLKNGNNHFQLPSFAQMRFGSLEHRETLAQRMIYGMIEAMALNNFFRFFQILNLMRIAKLTSISKEPVICINETNKILGDTVRHVWRLAITFDVRL